MKKFGLSHSSAAEIALILAFFLALQVTALATPVFDNSFGTNGRASVNIGSQARASAVVIQPDGKIIVAGDAVFSNSARDIVLVRFNSNGTLDTSFGNNGRVFLAVTNRNETANAVALQPNGRIVVVGSTEPTDGSPNTDFLAVRFNANGSLDTSFGNLGVFTLNQGGTDVFNAVAIQPDGKIVAAGRTSDGDRGAVIRLTANGALDTSFAGGGLFYWRFGSFSFNTVFRAVALFPNGRILLGGASFDSSFASDILMLLEPNGAFAQDFGNGGFILEHSQTPTPKFDLVILPDGKFLALSRYSLRRYLSNGTVDQTFQRTLGSPCCDPTVAGNDIAVRTDGKFVVVGQWANFARVYTVAYDKNGRPINRVRDLIGTDAAAQSDNKIVIINSSDSDFTVTRLISITSPATRLADFDYDEKSDLAVVRSGEVVYVLRSTQSVTSYRMNRTSPDSIRIIPENYSFDTPDRFRLSFWQSFPTVGSPAFFNLIPENGASSLFQWGVTGDIPVGGDYDGVANTDFGLFRTQTEYAVFRPSNGTWYIFNRANNQLRAVQFGQNGDRPVPADYDYDGITDIAVWRPANGTWYILRSSDNGVTAVQWGASTDIPLTGDFDGDGKADFVVFRPSNGVWYLLNTLQGFSAVQFGVSTDRPTPGDYDGDGRHDVAVFRNGIWYLLQSRDGFRAVQWGTAGDEPVVVRY